MQVGAVLSEATHGVSAWVSSFIFKTNLDIFYSCHDSFLAYHGPHWYSLLVLLGALPAFQDPQPPDSAPPRLPCGPCHTGPESALVCRVGLATDWYATRRLRCS